MERHNEIFLKNRSEIMPEQDLNTLLKIVNIIINSG